MSDTDEMADLIRDHEVIKAQVNFLARSLTNLTAKATSPEVTRVEISDLMLNYKQALYDLRDGLEAHIKLDNHIFKRLINPDSVRILEREHEQYRNQINKIISIAESRMDDRSSLDELNRLANRVHEMVVRACRLIVEHIDHEDSLLKSEE